MPSKYGIQTIPSKGWVRAQQPGMRERKSEGRGVGGYSACQRISVKDSGVAGPPYCFQKFQKQRGSQQCWDGSAVTPFPFSAALGKERESLRQTFPRTLMGSGFLSQPTVGEHFANSETAESRLAVLQLCGFQGVTLTPKPLCLGWKPVQLAVAADKFQTVTSNFFGGGPQLQSQERHILQYQWLMERTKVPFKALRGGFLPPEVGHDCQVRSGSEKSAFRGCREMQSATFLEGILPL